jgi:putative oxygen-independent coproporphyrinogen III oxidase
MSRTDPRVNATPSSGARRAANDAGRPVINGDDGAPGFGVYLHWPFCAAKCPYCDFNSHVRHGGVDQTAYAAAFLREIDHMRRLSGPREVTSIFIGGGTPSLMDPETVGTVLDAVANAWHVPDGIEITMEANPSSVEASRFRGYRAAGVNRVSMGVQALNDADLKFLGRLHNVAEALTAIDLAREIFPRMSFDLIYARPDQKPEAWAKELEQAIALAADHLSLYQLTIEEGTPFFGLRAAGKLHVPDGEHSAELYELTQEVTAQYGLPAYEISNHARPGAESRHNLTYWRYGDYAGIGPGAHGRLKTGGLKLATATERRPESWLDMVSSSGHGIAETEELDAVTQADEMLLMGLRLTEGIDLARLKKLSGRDLDAEQVNFLASLDLVERIGINRLRCTPAGMLVLDAVVADLAF